MGMNPVNQHAFEVARPGECCNTVFAKRIEILTLHQHKKDYLSEMRGFLLGGLTILICGEASMLRASMRKMFHLCMFADSIWRNGPETV